MNELQKINESIERKDYNEIIDQFQKIINSGLLPASIETPEQAYVIMQKGKELGFNSLSSFDAIDVIIGKTTLKPKFKLALALKTGKVWTKTIKDWEPIYDEAKKIVDFETCIIGYRVMDATDSNGNSIINEEKVSYKWSEASKMGLSGKDNWRKQPNVMAYWRCLSKLLDRIAPDLTGGLYTTDELAEVANIKHTVTEDGNVTIVNSEE